jgi:hypothetical protein
MKYKKDLVGVQELRLERMAPNQGYQFMKDEMGGMGKGYSIFLTKPEGKRSFVDLAMDSW